MKTHKYYMKDKLFPIKMDKKLYEQLRKYSFSKNQSLAMTARMAIEKFIREENSL